MRFLVTIGLATAVLATAHAQGQAPAPQGGAAPAQAPAMTAAPVKGATTGFMHAIHATNNVETTLSFSFRCSFCSRRSTSWRSAGVMSRLRPVRTSLMASRVQ